MGASQRAAAERVRAAGLRGGRRPRAREGPVRPLPSAGDLGRAALRAAGRSATAVPERNVGRGLAAPATDDTAATALQGAAAPAVADPDGETRLSPAEHGAGRQTARRPAPRWSPPAGGRRTALARPAPSRSSPSPPRWRCSAAATATATTPRRRAPTTAADRPAARRRRPAAMTGILTRPNALTIADGHVWAMSFQDGAIALRRRRRPASRRPRARINVGPGGSSLACRLQLRVGRQAVDADGAADQRQDARAAWRAAPSRSPGPGATWRSPPAPARSGWPCATRPTTITARSRSCASTPARARSRTIPGRRAACRISPSARAPSG